MSLTYKPVTLKHKGVRHKDSDRELIIKRSQKGDSLEVDIKHFLGKQITFGMSLDGAKIFHGLLGNAIKGKVQTWTEETWQVDRDGDEAANEPSFKKAKRK
jgi:hypothetical protein